ncbi:MAG: hypothetical protein UIH27_04635 [Ruminococcus sp.]|nr:hypothetical protein [Ruminococcus sp.]
MKTKGTKNKRIKLPHGDGSIYYVENRNRYTGQVTLMIDGDKLRKTVYGKTEKEVKDKIRELHVQARAGNLHNPKKPKPMTIYDLADKMIEEQLMLNEIRQSSYDRKKSTLKMLSAISVVNETKTEAGMRLLYINEDVADFVSECVGNKESGLLFKSTTDKLITTNQVNSSYSKAVEDFEILDHSVYGKS